jgi:hypothetical protein
VSEHLCLLPLGHPSQVLQPAGATALHPARPPKEALCDASLYEMITSVFERFVDDSTFWQYLVTLRRIVTSCPEAMDEECIRPLCCAELLFFALFSELNRLELDYTLLAEKASLPHFCCARARL